MTKETQRHEITMKRVLYEIPGMYAVTIRKDVKYPAVDNSVMTMDVYYPPDHEPAARIPAVIFVIGYSDLGVQAILGCKTKEMESFISWGRLSAASGLVAITYTTGREPAADIHALIEYIRRNAASLGIDDNRIGVWACSGHGPNALSVLMNEDREYLKCAVLCYAYLLDIDGSTGVAEAAATFHFVTPCAGKSVEDLSRDTPMLIVRAGQDEMPRLNEVIDRFVARALSCNLPLTIINHPTAPHAFDLTRDSEVSHEVIRQVLAFLRFHLLIEARG